MIAGIHNLTVERSQETANFIQQIKRLSQHQISAYQNQNDQMMKVIKALAQAQLKTANSAVDQLKEQTHYLANQQIRLASSQIYELLRETLLENPKPIMAKSCRCPFRS